jgi:hypothetical protein
VDNQTLDSVWAAYEKAVCSGRIRSGAGACGRRRSLSRPFFAAAQKSAAFCRILKHAKLLGWIRLLMECEPKPLQAITSHKGSQQGVPSDLIHMTTYPLGYLSAAWIAFEDIHPDCGPLVYYPGSHKLPYVFSKDVGLGEFDLKRESYGPYHKKYEPYIQDLIAKHELTPHYFHAQKGDTLIWHANLLHGGSARKNLQYSRRSLVCHFFVKGSSFITIWLRRGRERSTWERVCCGMIRARFWEFDGKVGSSLFRSPRKSLETHRDAAGYRVLRNCESKHRASKSRHNRTDETSRCFSTRAGYDELASWWR